MQTNIIIREFQSKDLDEIADLFYQTVHTINKKHYNQQQLNAWATGKIDRESWNKSLLENYSLVAVKNNKIVGFGDISTNAYLDRLYVHKDFQGIGIANTICDKLESHHKKITVNASITAKEFFEKRGYQSICKQTVVLSGITLINYKMELNR